MKTTRMIIVAVGGQGNLLASSVLGEAALLSTPKAGAALHCRNSALLPDF